MDVGLDQQVLDSQMHKLGTTIDGFARSLNLSLEDFLIYQAGLLSRTLINVTPPRRKDQSMVKINDDVSSQFAILNNPPRSFDAGFVLTGSTTNKHGVSVPWKHKEGIGPYRWYSFQSDKVYGVAPERSLYDKTPEELLVFYKNVLPKYQTSKGFMQVGTRGKQSFRVMTKILTKKATVKKVIERLQGRIGRLKAAWAVSWIQLGSPGSALPQWISRHVAGSQRLSTGYAQVLKIPGAPEVTISNSASGAGNLKTNSLLARAVKIRTDAMMRDLKLYFEGVKDVKELRDQMERFKTKMAAAAQTDE